MSDQDWPWPKLSVFTPFVRRFTDERALDLRELKKLHADVQRTHLGSRYAGANARTEIGSLIYEEFSGLVAEPMRAPFCITMDEVLKLETTIFEFPRLDWDMAVLSLKEQVDLRHFLRAKEHFLANHERVAALLASGVDRIFGNIAVMLPEMQEEQSLFTIPLICTLPDPRVVVERVYGTLWEDQLAEAGLFAALRDRMYRNLCDVSDIIPYEDNGRKKIRHASQSMMPLDEMVRLYCGGTPFERFLLTPVPLRVSLEDRFSHMHVVGGSGAGKTTFLQQLIVSDLYSDDPPSLVIIDSQGDLINKLSRLTYFADHHDRFVFITPKDIEHPPAVNIFDVNRGRLDRYDAATKEQVTAGVIQTFDYLFSGLLGADLTAKQSVFFRFVARLMLAIPESMGRNATILDMIRLMADPAPYKTAIQSLPPIQREFFERDFPSKTFAQTKEQIRYRLNAILENPTLARLFTSPTTKVDLFAELNRGSVIFVDTAKDFLKSSSAHFGRIFISLVLQAILERAAIPEHLRKPAFLIVDEAANYFDSNIDDLLTEARKYKLGCVFAHQFLDQATYSLRSSLAANTSIKMAAGVSVSDARAMASDMRTTPDFILDQPKLHFACHIRNTTPNAVSVPVDPRLISQDDLLDDEAYGLLLRLNRLRVSVSSPKTLPAAVASAPREPEKDVVEKESVPVRPSSTTEASADPSEEW